MATKQKDKSSSKPRQRSRKVERPSEKLDQVQSPNLDPAMEEQIVAEVAAIEPVPVDEAFAVDEAAVDQAVVVDQAMAAEFVPSEVSLPAEQPTIVELVPAIISQVERAATPIEAAAPADHVSIGMQSIANAYRNYTNKSLEQTGSFVEKLMSARSFDRAAEVQIEFARQAYANLIAESQNICELYSRLTGQMFSSWRGFAMGMPAK